MASVKNESALNDSNPLWSQASVDDDDFSIIVPHSHIDHHDTEDVSVDNFHHTNSGATASILDSTPDNPEEPPHSSTPENSKEPPLANEDEFELLKFYKNRGYNQAPSLFNFLRLHPQGLSVIKCYEQNHNLSKATRSLLGRLLVIKEHQGKENVANLTNSRYLQLADEICALFKTEVPGTYYTSHISIGGGVSQRAQGILLASNNYLRKKHLDLSKVKPKEAEEIPADSGPTESLQFLLKHIEPWEEVQAKWKSSYQERKALNYPINDYFQRFSCLCLADGYTLLENDFDIEFPQSAAAFARNWPRVRQKLIKLFTSTRRPKDENLLQIALKIHTLKGDSLDFAVLTLLAAALPKPRSITSGRGKRKRGDQEELKWNPTIQESREGLIFAVTVPNDVQVKLKLLQQTLMKFGVGMQPRPVIVGTIDEIISCHIFVDGYQYNISSPSRALEACFKLYYALNAEYPPEARPAWQFIEKSVFALRVKHEKPIPTSVCTLVGEVNCQ